MLVWEGGTQVTDSREMLFHIVQNYFVYISYNLKARTVSCAIRGQDSDMTLIVA